MSDLDHWLPEDYKRSDEGYPMVYETDSQPDALDEEEDDGVWDWLTAIGQYLSAVERGEDPGPAPYEVVLGPAASSDPAFNDE